MPVARLIVCEKTGKWAVALRRRLRSDPLKVLETRSLDQCWAEVEDAPASLVVVEVTDDNLRKAVPWLKRLSQSAPRARSVALGDRGLESAEWLLREAGAVHVVFSPRALRPLVRVIRCHMKTAGTNPPGVRQQIWRQLPWTDVEGVS